MSWALGAASGIGILAVLLLLNYVPPLVMRWAHVASLRRRAKGRLVLTYDDGPDDMLTPRLLDLLAREGVKATFYLVGFRVERGHDVCDRIVEEGHDLGCHTFQHRNYWKLWPWTAVADAAKAYRTMDRWTGTRATFRPAFGKMTTLPMVWLWLTGRRLVWWTDVGGDTVTPLADPAVASDRILDRGGGVLLLHSRHHLPARERYVLALTQALIRGARERGLTLSTVSELGRPYEGNEISGAR